MSSITEIHHTQGDTLTIEGVVFADDTPMDITGCNILFTMRAGPDKAKSPVILQKTATIVTAASGEYRVKLSAAETNIEKKKYFYDIQLTDSLGDISTLILGYIHIDYDVT